MALMIGEEITTRSALQNRVEIAGSGAQANGRPRFSECEPRLLLDSIAVMCRSFDSQRETMILRSSSLALAKGRWFDIDARGSARRPPS